MGLSKAGVNRRPPQCLHTEQAINNAGQSRRQAASGCETKFFEAVASAWKIVKLIYVFAYKWACASVKAALARRTPKLVGMSVAHWQREASWSAERQFRFAYETGALGVTRRILSHTRGECGPAFFCCKIAPPGAYWFAGCPGPAPGLQFLNDVPCNAL
jgi:hypothetical protein